MVFKFYFFFHSGKVASQYCIATNMLYMHSDLCTQVLLMCSCVLGGWQVLKSREILGSSPSGGSREEFQASGNACSVQIQIWAGIPESECGGSPESHVSA